MITDVRTIASLAQAVLDGDLACLPILADALEEAGGPGQGTIRGACVPGAKDATQCRRRKRALASVLLWATDRPAWEAREAERLRREGTSPWKAVML